MGSPARLRRICNLVQQGETAPIDRRNGLRKNCCISAETKAKIEAHIRSYTFRVAHYGKAGKKTRYLPSNLNIHKIWI